MYLLRQFSISGRKVVHEGDSLHQRTLSTSSISSNRSRCGRGEGALNIPSQYTQLRGAERIAFSILILIPNICELHEFFLSFKVKNTKL